MYPFELKSRESLIKPASEKPTVQMYLLHSEGLVKNRVTLFVRRLSRQVGVGLNSGRKALGFDPNELGFSPMPLWF